jgi:alpha-beta hydrolase superfamily lysophospholipase
VASGVTEGSGCGRQYDRVVCYAHSTGALAAALYGTEGKLRDTIAGFIFNSPFWSWNVPLYQRVALRASQAMVSGGATRADETEDVGGVSAWIARATELNASYQLAKGGDISAYSAGMRMHYEFPELLKSTRELAVTAGWAAAVGNAQARLRAGELAIAGTRPTLCLYTDADEVLGSDEIDTLSDLLVPGGGADGKAAPIWSDGLVERKIETSEWDPSSHDVLATPSPRRNGEAFSYIEEWLKARE